MIYIDANTIQTLISSLGFPIVVCVAMFWFINKTLKDFTSTMRDSLKDLSKSIDSNTTATDKLVTTVELISRIEEGDNNRG